MSTGDLHCSVSQQIMFYFTDIRFIITSLSCLSNKLSHSDFLTKT